MMTAFTISRYLSLGSHRRKYGYCGKTCFPYGGMLMILKTARLISLLLMSLAAGVAFCHALELPNKMALPASTWLDVQKVLYNGFGRIIGSVEYGALVATLVVLFLVRKRRSVFVLTVVAALCIATALIVWTSFVGPANLRVDAATSVPPDWTQVRDQWEYGHAARAALFVVGLVALILSVLADTPTSHARSVR